MPVRAAFVYANPRLHLLREIEEGTAPDTGLLGQNHLGALGIESWVHDAPVARLPIRVGWNLRELALPWALEGADVVCTPLAMLLPLASRLRRKPRALVFNLGLNRRVERSRTQHVLLAASLRTAAAVVCFATAQRERLLERTRLPPERVHLVLFGVDERFYRPPPVPDDGYVLAVGRDLARDYATFAEAMRGLDAGGIVVASERNLEGVRLPANVELRLDVPYTELRALYEGARCVVVPTRHESYPYGADCSGHTVLLEALACARPTVVSARSTNSDYVRPGDTALEPPPEDPQALREAIARLLSDGECARALAAAGRRAVEERFTTRRLAERLAPLIRAAAQ